MVGAMKVSELSRELLGKIVDEVFDGAIEDASVIEDIYRVIAREQAAPVAAPVQVRPLEWLDVSKELEKHGAMPPVGPIYTVEDDGFTDGYHVTASQLVLGNFPTLEAAKAAARADYETRIRSALISGDTSNG
jgi:hypothetical protein